MYADHWIQATIFRTLVHSSAIWEQQFLPHTNVVRNNIYSTKRVSGIYGKCVRGSYYQYYAGFFSTIAFILFCNCLTYADLNEL